jgi:tetratricopeptide (TPR) repeat protein
MRQKYPTFVNREQELKTIQQAIVGKESWGTCQLVFVYGPGGIGKTRLLQKVYADYQENPRLAVSELLDLFETELRVAENFDRRITEQVDREREHFGPYRQSVQDWMEMEAKGVGWEALTRARERMNAAFLENYRSLAREKRIVLLVDTFDQEVVHGTDVWSHLLDRAQQLENTVLIVAGRWCDAVLAEAGEKLEKWSVHPLELQGFEQEDANQYFDGTESLVSIDPEMREKIRLLTGGRPILMALAIEWLERSFPLPEIEKMTVEEIRGLSDVELESLQGRVSEALVKKLLEFKDTVDKVVLNMAWIHRRFDAEILSYLMGMDEKQREQVIAELETLPFTKVRPEGICVLHDSMTELVKTYVWPYVDQDGTRRRSLDERMENYYGEKLETLDQCIADESDKMDWAHRTGDSAAELQAFEDKDRMERQRWVYEVERLFYTLRASPERGVDRFVTAFDKASREYRLGASALLVAEISGFEDKFSGMKRYVILIRKAEHLVDAARMTEAREILQELMKQYADGGEREVDMLTRLANCAIKLGELPVAIEHLERALSFCQEKDLHRWIGTVENVMGLVHRRMGRWREAVKYYRASLEHSVPEDEAQFASALNNLGYVMGLESDYDSALVYCNRALEIRERLGRIEEIGISHNTLSILYRSKGEYETSLRHSVQALSLFERADSKEWLVRSHCELGITRWYIRELDGAWESLSTSLEIANQLGDRTELPNILHRMGHVAWDQDRLEEAEKLLIEGYTIGEEVFDYQQTVNGIEGVVELNYYQGSLEKSEELREQYYRRAEEFARRVREYEDQGYVFPIYSGSMRRILGNIAYDRGDFEAALDYYMEAYPLMAIRGGYSIYQLQDYLKRLEKRIDGLPPAVALKWCGRLSEDWENRGLDREYSQMIDTCNVCRLDALRRKGQKHG